jgi:hypothetical protein
MAEYTYDVAFSFLAPDQDAATSLSRRLSSLRTFLYTEQQKQLAGENGYQKFASVFAEQARLVAVVYRDGWGDRGFTFVECTAIKRRTHREGAAVLFVVVAAIEARPKLPDRLPVDHVYWDLPTFGIDDAADAIRQRVRRVGGAPKIETAAEMAIRQAAERRAVAAREHFRQMDGPGAARAESRNLFDALADIAAASNGVLAPPSWNNTQTAISFEAPLIANRMLLSVD